MKTDHDIRRYLRFYVCVCVCLFNNVHIYTYDQGQNFCANQGSIWLWISLFFTQTKQKILKAICQKTDCQVTFSPEQPNCANFIHFMDGEKGKPPDLKMLSTMNEIFYCFYSTNAKKS